MWRERSSNVGVVLLAASVLGVLLKLVFHGEPIWALGLGGTSLIVAGLFTLRVREPDPAR